MAGQAGVPPRVHKRSISDQQRRREIALERQKQSRRDLQQHARQLASGFSPPSSPSQWDDAAHDADCSHSSPGSKRKGILEGTKLKGGKAREFYSQQLMLPEWMVDIPINLKKDWCIMARPAGQRCLVIAANGSTISRQRNGRILHCFPSALPNGARTRDVAAASHVYCILDCIFHAPDKTYYVVDMMCWRGYSLYDCSAEFRFFWMTTKLAETGALNPPTAHHRYRFSVVPVFECNTASLQAVYTGSVAFVRDGLLFVNRHAHYQMGLTPLVLLWKDAECSLYLFDTDSQGNVPAHQQVVLELCSDGTVVTSDQPPTVLGSLPSDFLQQNAQYLKPGDLLRFAIGDQGISIVDGKPVVADIHFQGLASKNRAGGADSCTKILFQYAARHSPLTIADLLVAIEASDDDGDTSMAC
ncbi:unnamed protein product [Sphagnum troendelagicum]|uniref:Snurportin-1 n=1 Tax=Sphagnum troendelagicum TaxID=128251 RepID=A0ABP0UUU0_9BRYO